MVKFCPNCGNPIDEGAVFCDNCGTRLDTLSDHQPGQAPAQPYGAPDTRQPRQKKKAGPVLALGIAGVAVIAAVIVSVLVILSKLPSSGHTEPTATPSVTEPVTEHSSGTVTAAPTNKPVEATTPAPTAAPTEAPAEPKADLPYADSLGEINPYDFAWIADAMSGGLTGEFLSKDALLGKWKGEFIFDGIWELVYLTIDRDGTVTVEPYRINYGDGWEDESGDSSYTFQGAFDINRVFGSGSYGNLDLYQFLLSGGTQYGVGELNTASGNKAEVYLVRP